MGERAKARPTEAELRAQLEALPEGVKGEIIDGELFVMPRPRARHARVNTGIGHFLGGAFNFGGDESGGWVILVEPGIELPGAPEVAPDVAGWRRERFAWPTGDDALRIVPDWVCEVLSPSNARYDRRTKFPFYARVGVSWLWVVDPAERTVEIRKLVDGRWSVLATFADDDAMRAEPFEDVEVPVGRLWVKATPSKPA